MGSRRTTTISPLTGLFGALLSAMLQVFLTLAPVDALADDSGFENITAATQLAPLESGGFILSGSDPVQDTLDRTFEPGEIFAGSGDGTVIGERNSVSQFVNAPAGSGTLFGFYRTRAPPYASFS